MFVAPINNRPGRAFGVFWHTERPGPRVLTRGFAGVEPLWAELHTARGRGEGWDGMGVGGGVRMRGQDCPLT